MRRIDRAEALLQVLRDRPGITAAVMAEDLGVSIRTVFRDLAELRDRGYPLEADRGRGGGVRVHPNWGLGRVLLSTEEALGALLSLAVSEKLAFPMFAPDLRAARRKIVDAFPSAERRRLGPLRERIFVGPSASRAVRDSYGEPHRLALAPLQRAFVREHPVHAEYVKENGELTARRIEPHALLINWPAWYLLAFDHLRQDARTFRFDRFRTVAADETHRFRPRPQEIARAVLTDDGTVLVQRL